MLTLGVELILSNATSLRRTSRLKLREVERSQKNGANVVWSTGRTSARVRESVLRERPPRACSRRLAEAAMDPATQSASITALALSGSGKVVDSLRLDTLLHPGNQAHAIASRDMEHREELHSPVHQAAANLYADSLDKTWNPASLIGMYSLIGLMTHRRDKVLLLGKKSGTS